MDQQISEKVLHLIANSKSGTGAGASVAEIGAQHCLEQGWKFIYHEILDYSQFEKIIDEAIAAALEDGGVVAAAGGDGTIRAIAEKVQEKKVKFAVIPCGTFNFFARTHSIPIDHHQAFQVALNGECRLVRLAEINKRIFLVNASLGLYAKAIREREASTKRFGRNQIVVIISTVISLLKGHRLLTIEMITEKTSKKIQTSMLFIGNNSLQLRDLSMKVANCMKQDSLAVVAWKPMNIWQTVQVILRGLSKSLENENNLVNFCVDSLTITTKKKTHTIALDGEIFQMNSPFVVKALPESLKLMKPPEQKQFDPNQIDRI